MPPHGTEPLWFTTAAYQEQCPLQADTELRDAIQKVALENLCYGYRRVLGPQLMSAGVPYVSVNIGS